MAASFTSLNSLLQDNDKQEFVEAAKILMKFADNILKSPNEPKYRRIRLGNPTVEGKLVPVSGALECLFEMGFEEVMILCKLLFFLSEATLHITF